MDNLSLIGWAYKLKRAMLGNDVGTIGYVFNQYQDFDEPDGIGIQIIFPNGEYDGFSVREQYLFLEPIRPILEYAGYEFQNVMVVGADFNSGYWDFNRKDLQ